MEDTGCLPVKAGVGDGLDRLLGLTPVVDTRDGFGCDFAAPPVPALRVDQDKLNPADLEVLMVALVAELLGDLW